jgi:hypothetical protein
MRHAEPSSGVVEGLIDDEPPGLFLCLAKPFKRPLTGFFPFRLGGPPPGPPEGRLTARPESTEIPRARATAAPSRFWSSPFPLRRMRLEHERHSARLLVQECDRASSSPRVKLRRPDRGAGSGAAARPRRIERIAARVLVVLYCRSASSLGSASHGAREYVASQLATVSP